MTKVVLFAFLMVNGVWYPGEFFDGWAPAELSVSIEECHSKLPELNSLDPRLKFECHEFEVEGQ